MVHELIGVQVQGQWPSLSRVCHAISRLNQQSQHFSWCFWSHHFFTISGCWIPLNMFWMTIGPNCSWNVAVLFGISKSMVDTPMCHGYGCLQVVKISLPQSSASFLSSPPKFLPFKTRFFCHKSTSSMALKPFWLDLGVLGISPLDWCPLLDGFYHWDHIKNQWYPAW